MATVQTFLKKPVLKCFKAYMEKRGLTPYKAAAELIEMGLTHYDQCRGRLDTYPKESIGREPRTDRETPEPRREPPFLKPRGAA